MGRESRPNANASRSLRWRLSCAVVAGILVAAPSSSRADQDGKKSDDVKANAAAADAFDREVFGATTGDLMEERRAAVMRYRRAADMLEFLASVADSLKRTEQAQSSRRSTPLRITDADVAELRAAVGACQAQPPDQEISSSSDCAQRFNSAFRKVESAIGDGSPPDGLSMLTPTTNEQSKVLTELYEVEFRPAADPMLRPYEDLFARIDSPVRKTRSDIDAALQRAQENEIDIAGVKDARKARWDAAKGYFDSANRLVAEYVRIWQGKRRGAQDQIKAIDERLKKLAADRQTDTFMSVYFMMGLLLAIFLMTIVARLLAVKLQGKDSVIIGDRTLIEFGGMSFLLLTVIILANRSKLESQAVATLLGTMAGYIFGKGMARSEPQGGGGGGGGAGAGGDAGARAGGGGGAGGGSAAGASGSGSGHAVGGKP